MIKNIVYICIVICFLGLLIWHKYTMQSDMCYDNRNHFSATSAEVNIANKTSVSVLLLGNSLIYDNTWAFDKFISISCSRRGMTLKQFNEENLIAYLDHNPTYIILSFGTVEAVQAENVNLFSHQTFDVQLELLLLEINTHTNPKNIIVNAIPPIVNDLYDGNSVELKLVVQINNQLRHFAMVNNLIFIDLYNEFDGRSADSFTYDGIHLTYDAYQKWRNLLSIHLLSNNSRTIK